MSLDSRLIGMVAVIALCGCNRGPDTTPVFGKVTLKGQPVQGATVVLAPTAEGLRTAVAETDAEGNFKMSSFDAHDGAQPGNYQVIVSKVDKAGVMSETEMAAYVKQHGKDPPAPKFNELLPKKYADPQKSGLTANVPDSGELTLNLDLN